MPQATVQLKLTEPKKHSVRYDVDKTQVDPPIRTLYVDKVAFHGNKTYPATIDVTINWE